MALIGTLSRYGTVALLLVAGLLATGCTPVGQPDTAAIPVGHGSEGVQIHLFDQAARGTLSLADEALAPTLLALDPAASYATLTEADMVSYDWDHQLITFNQGVRARYESNEQFLREAQPFLVTFNGDRLWGGMILFRYSAQLVKSPALYVLGPQSTPDHADAMVLVVAMRPTHDLSTGMESAETRFPQLSPDQDGAIRQHLQANGLLAEVDALSQNAGTSATAPKELFMPLSVTLTANEILALLPLACPGEVHRLYLDSPPALETLAESERAAAIEGLVAKKLVVERDGTLHLAPVVRSSLAATCSPQHTMTFVQWEARVPQLARTVNLADGAASITYRERDGSYHFTLATAEADAILVNLHPLLKEPTRGSQGTRATATASFAALDQAADSFAAIEGAFREAGLGWPTELRASVATMVTATRLDQGEEQSDSLTMLREGDTVWLFRHAHGATEIELVRTSWPDAYQIVREMIERYL